MPRLIHVQLKIAQVFAALLDISTLGAAQHCSQLALVVTIEEILTIAIVVILLRYYCDSCDTIAILLR